jgi:trimethylamine:corrinoid methyltransferase-like protein
MIYSERALNILNDAGADVDFRAGVAKIPSHLVQEALDKCKRPVRLSFCSSSRISTKQITGNH